MSVSSLASPRSEPVSKSNFQYMNQDRSQKLKLAAHLSKGKFHVPMPEILEKRKLQIQQCREIRERNKQRKKQSHPTKAKKAAEAYSAKQRLLDERKIVLKERATPSELALMALLDGAFIHFKFQKGFIQGAKMFYIIDFYLPNFKLCIEVDGRYHDDPQAVRYDKIREKYLTDIRGLAVLRIRNEEVADLTQEQLSTLIRSAKRRMVNYSPGYHGPISSPVLLA